MAGGPVPPFPSARSGVVTGLPAIRNSGVSSLWCVAAGIWNAIWT